MKAVIKKVSDKLWSIRPRQFYRFLAFFIPGIILFAIFVQRGVYPFGDRSVLAADLYHQYMPFLQEFQEKLKTGASLGYTFNIGIGTNFTALYTYYLASPIHFLSVFVGENYLMEFIAVLIWLKLSLCGLTACLYFQKRGEEDSMKPLLFSLFYAFSGYMCAYYYNIMWLDVLVLAPLVVMGLEALVKEGKWKLYTITLGLCIFSNFYISIMLCLFLVLYFLGLLFMEGFSFKRVGKFAGCSLMAGALAGVLLVPEILFLLESEFAGGSMPKEFTTYFSIFDVLSRHCFGVTVEKGLDHWPNLYCGAAVYFLVPLFSMSEDIPLRKRFTYLALTGFLLFSFSIRNLDFIWHGMNFPDSLPARQSFLYILLVLTMGYEALLHIRETTKKQLVAAVIMAMTYLLLMEKLGLGEDFASWTILVNLGLVCLYGVLCFLYRQGRRGLKGQLIGLAALALVVAEATANLALTSISTINREAYLKEIEDYRTLYDQAKQENDGFFRMEKWSRKIKNDGALYHIPMASTFSSTQNAAVKELYRKLGMRYSKVFYEYGGATPLAAGLLTVQYMLSETPSSEKGERENSLYTKVGESGKVELYRNNYTLPFGFVVETGFDLPMNYEGSGIELQNALVPGLFIPAEAEHTGNDVVLNATEDGYYFATLETGKVKKVKITGGHPYEIEYKDLKRDETIDIGELKAGDTVIIENDETDGSAVKLKAYRLDEQVLKGFFEEASREHMEAVSVTENSITGHLSLEEAGRVILSVPVEPGMQVLLNGEKVEAASFGEALLALDLEPGSYDIEVHYPVKGFGLGLAISAMDLVLIALLLGIPAFREKSLALKRKKVQNDNDEF